jgi:hypothetical protein
MTANAEIVDSNTQMIPAERDTGIGSGLAVLAALKDISAKDTEAQVSAHRIYAETALQATRDSNQANMQIMGNFMTAMMTMNKPAPAVDPALSIVLQKLAEGQERIAKLLEGEEEEEEEKDNDVTRYLDLVKNVKRHGMGALWDFAKDQGAMALVEALPTIKAKLPELIPMISAMVNQLFQQMQQAQQAPPAPAPVPAPRRVVAKAPPPPSPTPVVEMVNGHAEVTPPIIVAPDSESPEVS